MMKKFIGGLLAALLVATVCAQTPLYYNTTTIPPTAPQGTIPCQANAGTQAWQTCTTLPNGLTIQPAQGGTGTNGTISGIVKANGTSPYTAAGSADVSALLGCTAGQLIGAGGTCVSTTNIDVNGVLYGNGTGAPTAATVGQVIALWSGCNASNVMGGGGACVSTPTVGGQIVVAASGDTSGVTDRANIVTALNTIGSSIYLAPLASQYFTLNHVLLVPGNGTSTFYIATGGLNVIGNSLLKIQGVWIEGQGRGVTNIDYNPGTSGPLFINQGALDLKFSGITFTGHDATSGFLRNQEQAGLTNIQDETLEDVEWQGSWNNVFRLTGGNNNSEWKFARATINASINNWIYTPPAVASTITSGSSTITATINAEEVVSGDTGKFSSTCAPVAANTQVYVVNATTSNFQVSTTRGGSAVTFTANCTPSFAAASDQFLNFWFDMCKFDTGTSNGQWLTLNYGGSVKISKSDVSGHAPGSLTYLFNLLGTVHAQGVENFEADGLRIEHTSAYSRTIHSQWPNGAILFNNLDESSQQGRWSASNAYAFYEIVNSPGPTITYNNSQLMGVVNFVNNSNNYNYQHEITYNNDVLLETPSPWNFVTVTNNGNSGGYPVVHFHHPHNNLNASTVGYHEVGDTDVNWNYASTGVTQTKTVSCVAANSDFPINGNSYTIRLPLYAMITQIRYWNPSGSGAGGAYNYSIQTTEATPTVLAGGAGTAMAGLNASTALPASSMYVATPNFVMTTDLARTITLTDNQTRTSVFTNPFCLIDYQG